MASMLALWLASVTIAAEQPNIVFVLTDDQAPWALGASGYDQAKTPNLDRLFSEGAHLTNAFVVTPVCSPSRAALMTGRYGTELGITEWLHPTKDAKKGLDPETICWPEVLAEHGYTNALIGKWHLGLLDKFHPTRMGFEHFFGFRAGGTRPKDPPLEKDGVVQKFEGLTTDILTDHAIEFLKENQKRPFLLSVHYRAPHRKWLPVADEDWAPFENMDPKIPNPDYPKLDVPKVKNATREYLASVRGVDRNLGRLLRTLDELELSDNTVVIFTSDHGYNMGHNGMWMKGNGHWILTDPPAGTTNVPKGQRPNMYDNSLRVPAAVRWPAKIKPGTVITETISNLDWYPTILAMAGVPVPKEAGARGHNFLPLLEGEVIPWDNDFYAEYSTSHQTRTDMRAYRTPEWKLIRDFNNAGRDELYDLKSDAAEAHNLIDSSDEKVKGVIDKLDQKIRTKMKEINDPVLSSTGSSSSASQ
ncbi:Arylsulfatase [Planctomycetes bacterium Pan216]|uniref:Arylsulfatase n=1 Tax=Kolteria novifilia TaxID=2527975 RepID=A0A518BAL3_9BACT|nr:Arylsulfatase [Planctomycetes bacterium Pan216]